MSKFKPYDLEEAEQEFPLVNEETLEMLKGGCGECESWREWGVGVYTLEEYEALVADNKWTGGCVCGMGYVFGDASAMGEKGYGNWHVADGYIFCGMHDTYFDFSAGCSQCYQDAHGTDDYSPYNNNNHEPDPDEFIPRPEWNDGNTHHGGNQEDSSTNDTKTAIDLMDTSKFVAYSTNKDCLATCKAIMDNYNVDYGDSAHVYQLGIPDEKGKFLNYGDSLEQIEQNYANALDCIDRHLENGRPIIVGIDYGVTNTQEKNNDKITDHFVVIVGRGYDELAQQTYYTFMETAVNDPSEGCNETQNRLYYNSTFNSLCCVTSTHYADLTMMVTQVRPNDGKNVDQTVDSNCLFK